MQHDLPLLRVANACHPDMDDHERYGILRTAAAERRHGVWIERLAHMPGAHAPVGTAMRFLRELEEPWPTLTEPYTAPPPCRHPGAAVLLLVLLLAVLMLMLAKKK